MLKSASSLLAASNMRLPILAPASRLLSKVDSRQSSRMAPSMFPSWKNVYVFWKTECMSGGAGWMQDLHRLLGGWSVRGLEWLLSCLVLLCTKVPSIISTPIISKQKIRMKVYGCEDL